MTEITTTLGMEDVYNLLEIIVVDAYNRKVMQDQAEKDKD